MNFESLLLRLMLAAAIVGGLCLASLAFDRWRRRRSSTLHSEAFRSAHVQPTQKAPPPAPRVSANPTREWQHQTNSGMY